MFRPFRHKRDVFETTTEILISLYFDLIKILHFIYYTSFFSGSIDLTESASEFKMFYGRSDHGLWVG